VKSDLGEPYAEPPVEDATDRASADRTPVNFGSGEVGRTDMP